MGGKERRNGSKVGRKGKIGERERIEKRKIEPWMLKDELDMSKK